MTSFVYLVSIAFHTSVPARRKCTHTSRKKFFWLRVQPLVCTARCTSSSDLKDLHPIASLSGPKTWKSPVEVWRVRRMWKTLKGQSWFVATVERAVWDRALSRWSKTPAFRRSRRLDLIAGRRWILGDLHTLYWSQGSPWACSARKLPLFIQKESITFPADVRNFFGFGEEVWRHSSLAFSGFSAGGSGPRFHLP
jgi:hypothetical protein